MARFSGKIGFVRTIETEPGIWEPEITERSYFGDITRNISSFQTGEKINENIHLNNSISIVADPFATNNFQYMRYITYAGAKWKIDSAEIEFPRIILSIGGLYNEE